MPNNNDRLASSKAPAPIGKFKNGQPIKVVVIDDVFIDRRIMTQIMRSAGFDVVGEAEDGELGIMTVENEKPQLVILDYVMPKMNGMATLKELKKRYPKLPVIMQTSESDKEVATQLIKEGANDYIVKPLDRAIVLEKLKRMVDMINQASGLSSL